MLRFENNNGTCYIHSVIHFLCSSKVLKSYFMQHENECNNANCIFNSLKYFLENNQTIQIEETELFRKLTSLISEEEEGMWPDDLILLFIENSCKQDLIKPLLVSGDRFDASKPFFYQKRKLHEVLIVKFKTKVETIFCEKNFSEIICHFGINYELKSVIRIVSFDKKTMKQVTTFNELLGGEMKTHSVVYVKDEVEWKKFNDEKVFSESFENILKKNGNFVLLYEKTENQ